VAELPALVRIYGRLVAARVRSDWQYRTSFVFFFFGAFFATFLDFLGIAVLFHRIPQLEGWDLAEVAYLYGTASVGFALGDIFVSEVEHLDLRIKAGTFDSYLIRPLGPLFQIGVETFAIRRLGKLLQASAVLVVALVAVDVDWSVANAALVVMSVAAATVIFSSLWVIASSIAFVTIGMQELANSVTYAGHYMSQYPQSIYAPWMRRAAAVLGLAFVNYLPALVLFDRHDPHGFDRNLAVLTPAVALLVALAARAIWTTGVRHYRSTGS
jgi:ABC-2 type transport system permease protein